MKKAWLVPVLALLFSIALTGCMFRSPSELYQLPQRSAGYEKLTARIDEVRQALEQEYNTTAETAVIYSGSNTSSIQLQDMDADGSPETAVTFLRLPSAEHPLRICFFTKQPDDDFAFSCMVEGDGAAIYAVDYVELSGGGTKELVVSWRISTNFYQLGVYSLDTTSRDRVELSYANQSAARHYTEATELMLTNYSGYSLLDIDKDSLTELAVIRLDSVGTDSTAEIYGWRGGAFVMLGAARLSADVKSLSRVRSNYVNGGARALYVTGTLVDGGQSTDILCWRDGELVNLTLDPEIGVSRETLRGFANTAPTDVNGDLILEMPRPHLLRSVQGELSSDFWLIDWVQYDISGDVQPVFTTYHNKEDSWYLEIPEEWNYQLTIGRDDSVSGERAVIFYHWNGMEEPAPFLAIYKLTGVNRTVRAARGSRFILAEDDSTIYAAAFLDNGWDCGLGELDVLERFYRIMNGWINDT